MTTVPGFDKRTGEGVRIINEMMGPRCGGGEAASGLCGYGGSGKVGRVARWLDRNGHWLVGQISMFPARAKGQMGDGRLGVMVEKGGGDGGGCPG